MICPDCKGKGGFLRYEPGLMNIKCVTCKGRGSLPDLVIKEEVKMNVYIVKFGQPVKLDTEVSAHFGSTTHQIYVVASSYEKALAITAQRFPEAVIRGVDQLNYGAKNPVIVGE